MKLRLGRVRVPEGSPGEAVGEDAARFTGAGTAFWRFQGHVITNTKGSSLCGVELTEPGRQTVGSVHSRPGKVPLPRPLGAQRIVGETRTRTLSYSHCWSLI